MSVLFIFIPIVIALRLIAGALDRDRIKEHIENAGGQVLDINWNPFGTGWFGSKNERIYDVTYRTRQGKTVTATCKTSMFSGVYWTSNSPPSDFHEPAQRHEQPADQQPSQCMSCGATIPAGESRCPKCGWSYKT
jgi:hypothetical protein